MGDLIMPRFLLSEHDKAVSVALFSHCYSPSLHSLKQYVLFELKEEISGFYQKLNINSRIYHVILTPGTMNCDEVWGSEMMKKKNSYLLPPAG